VHGDFPSSSNNATLAELGGELGQKNVKNIYPQIAQIFLDENSPLLLRSKFPCFPWIPWQKSKPSAKSADKLLYQ